MVYKKIGDKIPSLSSLLLAGALLGGCKENKNNKSEEEKSKSVVEPKGSAGNVSKSYPKGYVEAIKDMFEYFVQFVSPVPHLKNSPLVVSASELEGANAKVAVERLCKSFSAAPYASAYPESLKDCFSGLGNLKFRTGRSLSGLKQKFAYGTALNSIAQFFNDLHVIYTEMMDLIKKGAPEVEMGELGKKLDALFLKVKPNDGSELVFTPHHKFYDSKKCQLISGDQLVRFLTDRSENGTPNANPFGMPGLLAESISSVWVQGIYGEDVNGIRVDKSRIAEIGNIATRGAGIGADWTVEGKCKMDAIGSFPTVGVTHQFMPANRSSALATNANPDTSAPIPKPLTFGQCLFALFKGNQALDFIELSPDHGGNDWFKIVADDKKFQDLLKQADDALNADKFAEVLGKHIENSSTGLGPLFVVPDVKEIIDQILLSVHVTDNQKANEVIPDSQDIDMDPSGISTALLQNFTAILGSKKVNLLEAFKMCETHKSDLANILVSTASIQQKICVKVLNKILDAASSRKDADGSSLIVSNRDGSAKLLVDWIKYLVIEEAKNAVVYKDNSIYKATKVSVKIQEWIKSMSEKLSKKHGDASITYQDIKRETSNKFDIDKVVKAMESDGKAIKSILTAKVGILLNLESPEGSIDYKTHFPYLDLMDVHTKRLDDIRLNYVKNKGTKAPGA